MWAFEDVFYQIYPLGLCNAPKENDGKTVPRIRAILEWIPYLKGLGIGAIYFSPLWESDSHGYDARDLRVLDCRLGTNEDLKTTCLELHKIGRAHV